jgi:L-lysine 6-transaminase
VEKNVFHVSSRINSTWGGNLADMVRCARYLEIIHEDGLVANAKRVGGAMKAGLEALAREFRSVTNVRGLGLLLAIDLPDGDTRARVRQGCWAHGLAVLPCGPRSIRFRPPLIFTEGQARQALAILRTVLAETL